MRNITFIGQIDSTYLFGKKRGKQRRENALAGAGAGLLGGGFGAGLSELTSKGSLLTPKQRLISSAIAVGGAGLAGAGLGSIVFDGKKPLLETKREINMPFSRKSKKAEEKKKNIGKGIAYLGATGLAGQQTIRSGVPRLLGVRLESHSTNNKTAKEILKNGGWIDPNKSGSGAIRALESVQGINGVTDINQAKGKAYITGIHENVGSRQMPHPSNPMLSVTIDPSKESPLQQVLARKEQRLGYRAQSLINWDYVNEDLEKIKELQAKIDLDRANVRTDIGNRFKVKLKSPFESNLSNLSLEGQQAQLDMQTLQQKTAQRLGEERGRVLTKALIPTNGRSLYIGGSDDYFNQNFKPDFDDVRAMYSENKIKVHGNRASATMEALKREGGGSRLKGVVKLVKANPKRALAGVAILGVGGAITAMNAKTAYDSFNPDGKVKGFTRKSKSGKWSSVKSFIRKKLKRD